MSFTYHNQGFQSDRNKKMIDLLSQKNAAGEENAKGVFLFVLYGKEPDQAPAFITPPGLSDKDAEKMCEEFFKLFGKYAIKATKEKI